MQDMFSVDSEINILRVYVDRIAKAVPTSSKTLSENELKALNTLAIMTQAISTQIRTHYLTRGKGGQIEQGIMEALEELRIEMGL